MEIKNFFRKVWMDPVLGGVIATGITSVLVAAWAYIKPKSFEVALLWCKTKLTSAIPAYSIIIILLFCLIIILIVRSLNRNSIWKEKLGHYTFKELYEILQGQNLAVGTYGMNVSGRQPPQSNLLELFHMYSPYLNEGVTIEDPIQDGGYLVGVLAPKLVGFGIVKTSQVKNSQIDVLDTKFETSEDGFKLLALIEKARRLKLI